MGGIRLVLLLDGVQTAPIRPDVESGIWNVPEFIWEGHLCRTAMANGMLRTYGLQRVYRTAQGALADFNAALRSENFDAAWALLSQFQSVHADESFVDIVHDRFEIYPIADEKYGSRIGVLEAFARAEGGPSDRPWDWHKDFQKDIRDVSRQLLKMYLREGQRMLYEPTGKGGAKTRNGWFFSEHFSALVYIAGPPTLVALFVCARVSRGLMACVP